MQADTAMPTQSAPQASPTQPSSYAAPVAQTAAQAPAVSTTSQWVAPYQQAVAPAPQMQAQMGVSAYQSAPTASYPQAPQAAPQAENPYKEAFNKVVGLLSSPVQFPSLGQQSTQTPAEAVQANYGSQQATQFNSLGMQTSMPGINSNPAYSNSSSQASLEISPDQLRANGVSEASLEIIDHFGPDVPKVLNDYSCQLEDALIQTNQQLIEAVNLLQELSAGRLDVLLLALDVDLGDVATQLLFEEAFVFAAPTTHRLARRKRIAQDELEGERVLLLEEGHCLRDSALEVCRRGRAREVEEFRATSLGTLVQMVASGVGVTLLPEMAVSVEARAGEIAVVPFAPPPPVRQIGLAWRPTSGLGAGFRALGEYLETLL